MLFAPASETIPSRLTRLAHGDVIVLAHVPQSALHFGQSEERPPLSLNRVRQKLRVDVAAHWVALVLMALQSTAKAFSRRNVLRLHCGVLPGDYRRRLANRPGHLRRSEPGARSDSRPPGPDWHGGSLTLPR